MNFLFLGIFLNLFRFLIIKINLKNDKKDFIFRPGPTWMRRGTGPRGSATRAHAAPMRRYIYFIIITIYSIKFFSLAYMGRGNRTY